MNILVLNYEYPPIGGGGGIVSQEISELYSQLGHNVTIVTMAFGELPQHEIRNGVQVFRVKAWRKHNNVCKPWEQLTYIVSAILFLRQHLRSHAYDVCHTHFIIPSGAVAGWVKKHANIPYIITAHGSDVPGHNKKKFKILHKLLQPFWIKIVNNAASVISPSNHLQKLMMSNYDKYCYEVIPNGLQTKWYHSLSKQQYILTLSRLQALKGVQTVIEAMAIVRPEGWSLKVVGDGPYRRELVNLAYRLGIADKVEFVGRVDNKSEQHLSLLGSASIYVSASQFENFPISVMEALCSGAYPLLSDIEAHRQLIDEDELFFPVGDANSLAIKLQRAIGGHQQEFIFCPEAKDWNNIIFDYLHVLEKAQNGFHNDLEVIA